MPVQSKHIAGRARKPPPVPAPKPILKHSGTTRASPDRPTTLWLLNGPKYSPEHVQSVQKVEFSFPELNKDEVNNDDNDISAGGTRANSDGSRVQLMDNYGEAARGRRVSSSAGNTKDSGEISTPDKPNTPRTKHSRAQFRPSIGGDWALKECEELTDWANDVLKQKNLPLITDLRKSVGDGFTLPTILEIVSGVTLSCVKVSPQTKEDRVENLRKCLTFLVKRGCDVASADPTEIQDGNLKSSLLLVGNIRKHFQKSYTPTVNGHIEDVSPSRESPPPALPSRNMPGAVKLPGAVPTPFLAGRDPSPVRGKNVPGSPHRKTSLRDEDLIPGSLNKEQSFEYNKPPTSLISTTELGTNGVSQHGVEERRQHMAPSSPNARGILLRSSTGKPAQTPPPQETGAPQGVTRAWTASPRPQHNKNQVNGSSVEDRLRQLFNNNNQNNTGTAVIDKQGFHGGGSEVFDDGELLIVPPPQPRNTPDFDMMMLDNHGYGPGYRHPTNQYRGQRSNQGYVPSKPTDRWQGPRAEVILSRKPEPSPTLVRARTQPASQMVPGMTRGHDNHAFTHDALGQGVRSGKNTPVDQDHLRSKPPSPRKSGGNDLRSAWNKLYGANSQPPNSTSRNPSPHEVSNSSLNRGDNTRSSYGAHSPSRNLHNTSQYNVQYPPRTPPLTTRPVSAPAPADMHVHFEKLGQGHHGQGRSPSQDRIDGQFQGQAGVVSSTQRASPMGQSSSTQGHLDGSMSSQLTLGSHADPGQLNLSSSLENTGKSSFPNTTKSSLSSPSSVNNPNSPGYAIGPAAKYPEMGSRPTSAKNRISGSLAQGSPAVKHKETKHVSDSHNSGNISKGTTHVSANSPHHQKRFSEDLTKALKSASRGHHSRSFDYSFDDSRDIKDQSIFDYEPSHSESSGSVTPPLPPLSPTVTPPDSPDISPTLPRSHSATNISNNKMHETMQGLGVPDKRRTRRTSELQFKMDRKHHHQGKRRNFPLQSKGANLRDVKETSDVESNLSIDIDDTILTIDSHDTEQHPAGEILTSQEAAALRLQLQKLETMYSELQQKVEPEKGPQGPGPPPIGRQRRWSIGSSDTSSFRRESKYKPGKHIHHRHHSKEFKNINKRFQRLESHVVTLARSVAHLSSELRTHNTMVHDLDSIKRELREFKDNPGMPFPRVPGAESSDFDRFRGWVPSLTNTKRVNKLTKFFGAEPPLLELFLKKLGYEKYVANFKSEHIGMMELPYMTEERLEKIGIPMGPRIRILQEAQMCFRHDNFNIYIV